MSRRIFHHPSKGKADERVLTDWFSYSSFTGLTDAASCQSCLLPVTLGIRDRNSTAAWTRTLKRTRVLASVPRYGLYTWANSTMEVFLLRES